MDNHYFSQTPQAASSPKPFDTVYKGVRYRFVTDAGVFSKGEMDKGTMTLLSAAPERMEGTLLDLGCGWGAVGVTLGKLHPALLVTMADINERAIALAADNARANGVKAETVLSDGFDKIPGQFDYILLNPPIRAGKQVVYRLFDGCRQHLAPEGSLYVVIRKQQGADSAQKYLATLFEEVTIRQRNAGFRVFECKKGRSNDV